MKFLSIYNEYIEDGHDLIVYNNKFSNCIRFEETNKEAVKKFLITTDNKELNDLGFVTDSPFELEEEQSQYNQMKYSRETLNIMLIMTYKCNCNCKYCFEDLSRELYDDRDDDLIKITNYIIDQYKKHEYKKLDLHFFGGEPTLRYKEMIAVSTILRENNVNVRFNVITNGVLINEKMISELKEAKIDTFQITVDGPKIIHDQRRPLKTGKSSWDEIAQGLEALSNADSEISIRINIDRENVAYLQEICDSIPKGIIENEFTNIYIAPIVGVLKGSFKETMSERITILKTAWAEIHEKNLPISINLPSYSPCPVDSFDSAYYLDLKGNIYSCGGFVGKKHRIERIYDNNLEGFYERVNKSVDEMCMKCSFYPVCGGGCTFEADAFKNHCQIHYLKEVYDEYYKKYAEQ